jgi:hypothetical protein
MNIATWVFNEEVHHIINFFSIFCMFFTNFFFQKLSTELCKQQAPNSSNMQMPFAKIKYTKVSNATTAVDQLTNER